MPCQIIPRTSMGGKSFRHFLYGGKGIAHLLPATQVVIQGYLKATKEMGWMQKVTQMTPLWVGRWVKEMGKLKGFQSWDTVGISAVGDQWDRGKLIFIEPLKAEYQMHASQLYKYLQLRHTWQAEGLDDQELSEFAPLEGRLLGAQIEKKRS